MAHASKQEVKAGDCFPGYLFFCLSFGPTE